MSRDKRIYRATFDPDGFRTNLAQAEHLFVKDDSGTFYCNVHRKPADQCSTRVGDIVWYSQMDQGVFVATVVRTKPYLGRLILTRGDKIVVDRSVRLMYDAPFGPDLEDVQRWQTICQIAADNDYRERGEHTRGKA